MFACINHTNVPSVEMPSLKAPLPLLFLLIPQWFSAVIPSSCPPSVSGWRLGDELQLLLGGGGLSWLPGFKGTKLSDLLTLNQRLDKRETYLSLTKCSPDIIPGPSLFQQQHVQDGRKESLGGYVTTFSKPLPPDGNGGVFALDCEMVSQMCLQRNIPGGHQTTVI